MIELHAWSKREFLQQKNWNVLFLIFLFSFWCPVRGETAVPNFLFFAYIKKWGLCGNNYRMILLACIYHAFTKKEVTVLKYNNIPLVSPGIIDVIQIHKGCVQWVAYCDQHETKTNCYLQPPLPTHLPRRFQPVPLYSTAIKILGCWKTRDQREPK